MENQQKKGLFKDGNNRKKYEKAAEIFFLANAAIAIVSVFAIALFIFYKGLQPFMPLNEEGTYSFIDFITGTQWRPHDEISQAAYGIFYMIIGSIFSATGAIILGVPLGILTAVFMAEIAPKPIAKLMRTAVELLAGIPSVFFGIFGLGFIVPKIMASSPYSQGQSLLAVILVLTIMILPTIISLAENAIRAVPDTFRQGSYALGASKIYTIFKVVLPAAKSGILAGVVLGTGRAIGETMAVMLVAGNPIAGIPTSIWAPVRPMTTNIALEMGYAFGLHQEMLFATGVVLFIFIMIINIVFNKIAYGMKSS